MEFIYDFGGGQTVSKTFQNSSSRFLLVGGSPLTKCDHVSCLLLPQTAATQECPPHGEEPKPKLELRAMVKCQLEFAECGP